MSNSDPIRAGIVNAAATARHRVRAHFMALHAITPDDAIEYRPPGPRELKEFQTLVRAGVIRQTAPGHYWLDMDRLGAELKRRELNKVPIAIALSLLVAVGVLFLYRW
ncbi:hypothetical protein ACNI3Q_10580 [Sphingomonas sp. FW199]|uniref:hypothetical protein n=1 Tax=Sphingomonas sp. FW199 TaxID=3400217 RepID=UPI003CE99C9D